MPDAAPSSFDRLRMRAIETLRRPHRRYSGRRCDFPEILILSQSKDEDFERRPYSIPRALRIAVEEAGCRGPGIQTQAGGVEPGKATAFFSGRRAPG